MPDSADDRVIIRMSELPEKQPSGRLTVRAEELPLAPVSPPVAPSSRVGNPPSRPPSMARGFALALIFLAVIMIGAGTIASVIVAKSTGGMQGRSVRLAADNEKSLIEKGDLALVAPSVLGSAGGLLPSSWSGTAIPWRRTNDGRLVLVTNRHVHGGKGGLGAPQLAVEFVGGVRREVEAAGIARDPAIDLAVLVIDASGLDEGTHYRLLSPMTDASWSSMAPGDPVVAVGTPHGYPQTQTFGRVSALRNGIDEGDTGVRWIQVDCTVLPGNSGGPLLRAAGNQWEWIGVVTARGIAGIGFAIFSGEVVGAEYDWILGEPPDFRQKSTTPSRDGAQEGV